MATCRRCNRGLSTPTSIAVGIGPVCAAKESAEQFSSTPHPSGVVRAKYRVCRIDPGVIWIEDTGRECLSVTNDAHAVVAELAAEYGDRRIIYKDSMGAWDELKHDGAVFTGFAPARNMSPEEVALA